MIGINNLTDVFINEELLKWLGAEILARESFQEKVDISVAIVSEDEIRRLNKIYRDKDKPTDVLSFRENLKFILPPFQKKELGEIVICPFQIKEKEEDKIARVFIHGFLHLLGYDHQTEKESAIMEAKEKTYISIINLGQIFKDRKE